MSHVGTKLKYWRLEKSFMSIKVLSEKSGVKQTTISQIERGIRRPQRETLEKLTAVLNITLDQLADLEVPAGFFSPKAVKAKVAA